MKNTMAASAAAFRAMAVKPDNIFGCQKTIASLTAAYRSALFF